MRPVSARVWVRLLVAPVAVALLCLTPAPAAAHPWGNPPVAVVATEGDRVSVEWTSEVDDALFLGIELGLLDPTVLDWTWDGPEPPPGAGGVLLPPSEPLEGYLLDRIRVVQDGVRCRGEVEPFGDFVSDGATTVHRCPRAVGVVELEVAMLHDLHDAYRTFAQSRGQAEPRQAVFTSAAPRQVWTFGDAAAPAGPTAALVEIGAAVALAAAAAGLAAYLRRRRRGGDSAPPPPRRRVPPPALLRSRLWGAVPLGLLAAEPRGFGWLEGELVRLVDLERAGVVLGAGAVAVAFAIGAAHALAPGHGKALVGAYLVGARGRASDAVALGAVVAAMHSASVLLLGGVLFATVSLRADATLMGWMTVAAGALVAAVGAGLVARQVRLRASRRAVVPAHAAGGQAAGGHADDHAHARHHAEDHDHGHGHVHEPLPGGVRPLSRRGLVALGVSGGLLPSPSAFLVLATAILTGRALYGLALILAFSLGLATTLTAFGLAAVTGRTLVERRAAATPRLARLASALPLASAVAVLAGGLGMTALALWRL